METGIKECLAGFESHKKLTSEGSEYWMGRELAQMLDYSKWGNFCSVIEKAKAACASSGISTGDHFAETGNMVSIGSGAQRELNDFYLSRYACYLVAMNAEPTKPQVGYAMTYFAVKARLQEVHEQRQLTEEEHRLELRLRSIESNKRLAGAAKGAGVVRFGIFQDAGYRGLYGGMGVAEIKRQKGVPPNEELLDCIGPLELSAHEFRALLTEDRLNRNEVKNENQAIITHKEVGEEVRAVMKKEKGTSPEALPIAPSIRKLVSKHQRRIKSAEKALG